jgi:hypothetical protein
MTEQQTVELARNAAEVIDNEAYKQAMAGLKAQIVAQWKDCPVRDQEGALLLLQLAKLAEKFEGILTGMVQAGKLAQHQINLDGERNESASRKFFRRVA